MMMMLARRLRVMAPPRTKRFGTVQYSKPPTAQQWNGIFSYLRYLYLDFGVFACMQQAAGSRQQQQQSSSAGSRESEGAVKGPTDSLDLETRLDSLDSS